MVSVLKAMSLALPSMLLVSACGEDGAGGLQGPAAEAQLTATILLPGEGASIANPQTDQSINIQPSGGGLVATIIPGGVSTIQIPFDAPNGNVVGAGIRFGDNGPIRTIPINGALGQTSGTLSFQFQVTAEVCGNLSSICHAIKCYEFAVTSSGQVSTANINSVALLCGNCDEPSCQELITNCFQGTIHGEWSGRCFDSPISGDFVMTVDSNGNVSGSYDGDDSGEISGLVDSTGGLSASGGAGGASWTGEFSGKPGSLRGSGAWDLDDGCSGRWSGKSN